jgi:nucleotide-binding universal stress UspA family protein
MRVLVPIDGVERGERAAELAFELFPEATVLLLHVINPSEASYSSEGAVPSFPGGWYEQEQERAEGVFDEIEELAAAHDVTIERHTDLGNPARTIIDTAEEENVDHVVMCSHNRQGVSRILLGSVAETVVRRAPVPVTVAR